MYLSMQTKALRTEGQIVLKYNITLHMVSIRLTPLNNVFRTTRSTTYKLCPKELVQEHAFFMVSAGDRGRSGGSGCGRGAHSAHSPSKKFLYWNKIFGMHTSNKRC